MFDLNQKQLLGSILINIENAPSKVKDVLKSACEDQKINLDKLNLKDLGFAPKQTKSNFCGRPTSFGFGSMEIDKSFVCLDCTIQSQNVKKAYENKKIKQQQVVPFYVIRQKPTLQTSSFGRFCSQCYNQQLHKNHNVIQEFSRSMICLCGQTSILRKQTFCHNHLSQQEIQCEINEQLKQQFIKNIGYLLEIAISQKQNQLLNIIEDYLIDLNTNSVYYNRLTFQCINKDDLFCNLLHMKRFRFYYFLMGDIKTRKNLIKLVCRLYYRIIPEKPENDSIHNFDASEAFNQIDIKTWISFLINYDSVKKLCEEGYYHKVIHQFCLQKNIHGVQKILFETKLKQNNLSDLCEINFTYTNAQQATALLKKIMSILDNDQTYNKLESQSQQKLNYISDDLMSVSRTILKLILIINQKDIFKIISTTQLNQFLKVISSNFKYLQIKHSDFEYKLIPTFFKTAADSGNHKFAKMAWSSLAKQSSTKDLASHLYFVISEILGDVHRSQKEDKCPSNPQVLKNWFRAKFIPKRTFQIQNMIQSLQSDFNKLQQIKQTLNEHFQLDGTDISSKSKGIRLNVIDEFSLISNKDNFQQMHNSTAYFGQKYELSEAFSQTTRTIQYALGNEALVHLVQLFDLSWKISANNSINNTDNQGFYYFLSLVLCDSLTKGSNTKLRQRLQYFHDNDSTLKEYTINPQEIEKIKRLLGVKCKNLKSNCSICNKQETDRNKFCYPARLNLQKAEVSAIFGPENCSTNTNLTFCRHNVHADCYLRALNKSFYAGMLICDICHKRSNCIIPASYDVADQDRSLCCRNSLITASVLMNKVVDITSDLNLYFKTLVEHKGLKKFIDPFNWTEAQKTDKNTMENHLLQLLISIFESSSQREKKQHLQQIDEFIKLIQKCPRQDCRLVQRLFAKIIRSILLKENWGENIENWMTDITKALTLEECNIVSNSVQSLSSVELKLPRSQKHANKKPTLIYTFFKFPETAKQCKQMGEERICSECGNSRVDYIDLLKGTQICNNYHQKRNQFIIGFDIANGVITDQTTNFYRQIPLYVNDYLIPFGKRFKFSSLGQKIQDQDSYILRKDVLQTIRSWLI